MIGGILPQNTSIQDIYNVYQDIVERWNDSRDAFVINNEYDLHFPEDINETYFNTEMKNGLMREIFAFVASVGNLNGQSFVIPPTFEAYQQLIAVDNLEDLMTQVGDTDSEDDEEQGITDSENEAMGMGQRRIPRRKGQHSNSRSHSDLYTDENPRGTIHGLKFANVADALRSIEIIKKSGKPHAHKIQASVAMEQRARVAGKDRSADVYRRYIDDMKRMTGGKVSARDLQGLLKESYNPKNVDYGDWEIDKSLSGQRAKVFTHKGTKEVAVVHRGTKGIHDWGTDLKYALGFNISKTDRVKHGVDIQKKAEAKYGKENVSTLGHSLGSVVAREAGKDSKEIISLNGAYSPQDILFKPISNKEFNVRTQYDPVSALLPIKQNKNTFTIPSVGINPLTEHSTDTLKRVEPDTQIGKGKAKKMSVKELKNIIKKNKGGFIIGGKTKKELVAEVERRSC